MKKVHLFTVLPVANSPYLLNDSHIWSEERKREKEWKEEYESRKTRLNNCPLQTVGHSGILSSHQSSIQIQISSSSSCRATSTDIPDPLSPLLPIIHRFWQVFRVTSRILTAAVCMFELVVLLLLGHMRGSIGISLMSSSLLLQQCPACLVHLTCIVFVMGGRWPYSWCLVGCCRQDLFNIARNILV